MTAFKCLIYTRPEVGVPVKVRNEQFLNRLERQGINQAWDLRVNGLPTVEEKKGDIGQSVSITKFLPPSVSGRLSYRLSDKSYLEDFGGHDDHIFFKINSKKHPLRPFVEQVFTAYVRAFNSYYAYTRSRALTESVMEEYDKAEEAGLSTDRRFTVVRIEQVNYFDDLLCQRAFSLTAQEVFTRLEGKLELVKMIGNGVLIADQLEQCIEDPIEAKSLDERVRSALTF